MVLTYTGKNEIRRKAAINLWLKRMRSQELLVEKKIIIYSLNNILQIYSILAL